MPKTVTGSAVVGLLLVAGVWYGVTHYSDQERGHTMTREECVKDRKNNAIANIVLIGRWGGPAPATISYSITDQPMFGPRDFPPPEWKTTVKARRCDLILLHVTPTEGQGTTFCQVHKANQAGRGTFSENPDGGSVQCSVWYETI